MKKHHRRVGAKRAAANERRQIILGTIGGIVAAPFVSLFAIVWACGVSGNDEIFRAVISLFI